IIIMWTINNKNHGLQGLTVSSILLLLVIQFSCNKFLEVDPQAKQPSETFYKNKDDAMKAVNAMYAGLHKYNFNAHPSLAAEGMRSGDRDKGSDPGDGTFMGDYIHFNITPTINVLPAYWTG